MKKNKNIEKKQVEENIDSRLEDEQMDQMLKTGFLEDAEQTLEMLGIPAQEMKGKSLVDIESYEFEEDEVYQELKNTIEEREEERENKGIYENLSEEDREALELGKKVKEKRTARRRRWKGRRRVVVTAAALLVLVGGVLTATGDMDYIISKFNIIKDGRLYTVIDVNDTGSALELETDEEFEAYQEIEENLGIPPIYLTVKPEGMEFKEFESFSEFGKAHVYYEYKSNIIFVELFKVQEPTTVGSYLDGQVEEMFRVTIEADKKEVDVYGVKGSPDKEGICYSTDFIYQNCYYRIYGVMEKEEFVKMIEKIFY